METGLLKSLKEVIKMFDFIPDWEDWLIIGPASQDFTDDERERRKIEKDFDDDNLYEDFDDE